MSARGHLRTYRAEAGEDARQGRRPPSGHSGALDLLWAAVAAGVVWCLMSVTAAAALLAGGSAHHVPAAGHVEASPPQEPISARQLSPEPAGSGAELFPGKASDSAAETGPQGASPEGGAKGE